jgi:CDP-6-deoxy-D-xylo-4-hexulose-3-dehydrase
MWEKTAEFEQRFSTYQQCAGSVMVNSGSSADLLMAYLLTNPARPLAQSGDEVLIPVVTWPTHVWSAKMAGLKVRFVDVDPATLNLDLDDVENSIVSGRTRVLFPVHLMGNPCDMGRLMSLAAKHDLLVLEDCCEALGSEFDGRKVGNFGVAGSFSFFFSHHMCTMEGGMVSTNEPWAPEQLKILRAHGWLRNVDVSSYDLDSYDVDPRYAFCNWGFNLRPTELQAGFGLVQLEKLPGFNERRESLARRFFDFIDKSRALHRPTVAPRARPSWFALPLVIDRDAPFKRAEITRHLEQKGIETRPIVAGNLSRHPVSKLFPEFRERTFPGADQIHERGFYVGLSPMTTDRNMDDLINVFGDFLEHR